MLKRLRAILQDKSGQSTLEYILIIGTVVVVAIGFFVFARDWLGELIEKIKIALRGITGGGGG